MIDRKQFVISSDEWKWSERVETLRLKNGFYINRDCELHICTNAACDVVILGDAWQTDAKQDSPQAIIQTLSSSTPTDEIIAIEKSWCGRYLLIVGERIFLDAVGLLPIFYSEKTFSCSLRLLCKKESIAPRNPRIKDNTGMNWQPAPLTVYDGVRRLLPSQIINFQTGEICGRKLLPSDYFGLSDKELIDKIIEQSDTSLHNMRQTLSGKIHMSLTAGHDSRCQLALLEHAGLDYDCYTYTYGAISDDDRDVPAQLCKALNRKHHLIKMQPEDKARRMEYDMHCDRLADDGEGYSGHVFDTLADKKNPSILIKNSIWEIMVNYFGFTKHDIETKDVLQNRTRWGNLMIDQNKRLAIEEYFDWMDRFPQENLLRCNRFYYEQRSGCWLSAIEQATDVVEGINFFHLLNCREMISLHNAFSEEDRNTGRFQEKIISVACPQLSNFLYERIRKQKRKSQFTTLFATLNAYGFPTTALLYAKKIWYKIIPS